MNGSMLQIRTSPHLKGPAHTVSIMRNVVLALLPATLFGAYCYGLAGFLVPATATASCLISEWAMCRLSNKPSTLGDWSAVVTGLLLGLTLPPSLPLWMAALGGFMAIVLGKILFGGLGENLLNPALVGRAFLMAAFPASLTTWAEPFLNERFTSAPASLLTFPFLQPAYDALSGATPLGAMKFAGESTSTWDAVLGFTSGSIGESSALLIILGGLYLAFRGMLNWRIPLAVLLSTVLFSGALHLWRPETYADPVHHLFTGGLMLGAFFMATDMVTCPVTRKGLWVYSILIGMVVVVIRTWGGLPEGVMYAILLANACSPLIERVTEPKPFGTRKEAVR